MKREVLWRTRLQPFSFAVASVWNALSFRVSPTAGLVTYCTAFIVLIGVSLLDGSALHQLGLFLLFCALAYALLVAWLRWQGVRPGRTQATDEDAVLRVMCGHLARIEHLLLAGIVQVAGLRMQQPVLFYVGGMVALFVLGRLSHWLSFSSLLWIVVTVVLMLPAALSRGWVTVPSPEAVGQMLHCAAIRVQATCSRSHS